MRKALLVCLMCTISLSGFCQFFNAFQIDRKPGKNGHPMKSDLMFSAIFNTPMTDVEEIAKITSAYFAQDSLLEFVQWDEHAGNNVVHFSLRRGQYKTTCMGVSLVRNPVVLDFNINFQFVEGQMQMTFTDFSSKVYAFADENKNLYIGNEPLNELEQSIVDEWLTELFSYESIDKNARKDLRANIAQQFGKYEAARNGGHTQIITLDNMSQYKRKGMEAFWEANINLHKENHWVLGVDESCFEHYFSAIFMSYFQEIAKIINGEFEGVAIDGVEIYEKDADGKVRPVDPKQKKQWLKENRSL